MKNEARESAKTAYEDNFDFKQEALAIAGKEPAHFDVVSMKNEARESTQTVYEDNFDIIQQEYSNSIDTHQVLIEKAPAHYDLVSMKKEARESTQTVYEDNFEFNQPERLLSVADYVQQEHILQSPVFTEENSKQTLYEPFNTNQERLPSQSLASNHRGPELVDDFASESAHSRQSEHLKAPSQHNNHMSLQDDFLSASSNQHISYQQQNAAQQRFISVRSGSRVSINSGKTFKGKDSDTVSFKSCKDDGNNDFQSAKGDEEEGSYDESSEYQSELQYRDARSSLTEMHEATTTPGQPIIIQSQFKQAIPVKKEIPKLEQIIERHSEYSNNRPDSTAMNEKRSSSTPYTEDIESEDTSKSKPKFKVEKAKVYKDTETHQSMVSLRETQKGRPSEFQQPLLDKEDYDDTLVKKNAKIFTFHLWINVVINLILLVFLGFQLDLIDYTKIDASQMTGNADSPGIGYYKLLSFTFQPQTDQDGTIYESKKMYFFDYMSDEQRFKCIENYDIIHYRVMKDVCLSAHNFCYGGILVFGILSISGLLSLLCIIFTIRIICKSKHFAPGFPQKFNFLFQIAAFLCWYFIARTQETQLSQWSYGPYFILGGILMSVLKCIHFAVFYNRFKVTAKMELYLRDSTVGDDLEETAGQSNKPLIKRKK
ncbi:hypothetical protein FGO68_gene17618 [Halteria grandinella]|uniref:Transmembrane protein n=1 Tax=Halteria grandinella TaxID=5974 RepID=A0A8J8T951_HALGN|nr:hypothetical protein FGO68_gene17618 [Halteria grandinella]